MISGKLLAFDTETTGLFPWPTLSREQLGMFPDAPFAFGFCNEGGELFTFRANVDPYTREVSYETCLDEIAWLRDFCSKKDNTLVMHNAFFDMNMLYVVLGIVPRCRLVCTWISAFICNPAEKRFGLKPLSDKYFKINVSDQKILRDDAIRARRIAKRNEMAIATKESHGNGYIESDYWLARPELLNEYLETDVIRTMLLHIKCKETMHDKDNTYMLNIFRQEHKLLKVILRMHRNGVSVHPDRIEYLTEFYQKYMKKQYRIAEAEGYSGLNFYSPKQLVQVFCQEKGYITKYSTPNGQPQINSEQLMNWAHGYEGGENIDEDTEAGDVLARAILEYKAGNKNIAFMNQYSFHVAPHEDRDGNFCIHPHWKQLGPITGRLACGDPNLQNVTTERGHRRFSSIAARLREVFGPRPGHVWFLPDFSQMEVWVFAFASKEPTMCNALLEGYDFHGHISEQVWGERSDFTEYSKLWRQRAKLLLFRKLYGGGINKLAELVRRSYEEAKQMDDDFNKRFPGVDRFMESGMQDVRQRGYVTNLIGRRYPIPIDQSYKWVNWLVQGTCADILKIAMVNVDALCRRKYPWTNMIMSIHDEIVLEVPDGFLSQEFQDDVILEMRKATDIVDSPVLLPVDGKIVLHDWSHPIKPKMNCPLCEKSIDTVNWAIPNGIPWPGKSVACIHCQKLITFDNEMDLVKYAGSSEKATSI